MFLEIYVKYQDTRMGPCHITMMEFFAKTIFAIEL